MYFARDGTFVRTDIWREGRYLDLWSAPHFLSGIAVALGLHIIGFETLFVLVVGFLLLIAYEVSEYVVHIQETRTNRGLDVVVGMTSLVLVLFLAPRFGTEEIITTFVFVTAVDAVLSWFGWRASRKAAVLEGRLRTGFEARKHELEIRRAKFREQLQKGRIRWVRRALSLKHRMRSGRSVKRRITREALDAHDAA